MSIYQATDPISREVYRRKRETADRLLDEAEFGKEYSLKERQALLIRAEGHFPENFRVDWIKRDLTRLSGKLEKELKWARQAVDNGRFSLALLHLEECLTIDPKDHRIIEEVANVKRRQREAELRTKAKQAKQAKEVLAKKLPPRIESVIDNAILEEGQNFPPLCPCKAITKGSYRFWDYARRYWF